MNVEALNCPNCGAGVASDRTQCEFCKSRLKTMACPSCLGLMFEGSKYCGHCGAKAVETAVLDESKLGNCPKCLTKLNLLRIADTAFRECTRCEGMWSDVETFERLCSSHEQQSAVLGFIGERPKNLEPLSKISYVPCPDCNELMNRSNFAHASGVIIDICKKHGVWFDRDELPKIIEFIQKGGMEIARQREKREIEEQREKLRDEQRIRASDEGTIGLGEMFKPDDRIGIRRFIRRIFE